MDSFCNTKGSFLVYCYCHRHKFQELEKLASKKLRISAKNTMKIAEKLYTSGYISYPRTETNIFPKNMNLRQLVEAQTPDNRWGGKLSSLNLLYFHHNNNFRRTLL